MTRRRRLSVLLIVLLAAGCTRSRAPSPLRITPTAEPPFISQVAGPSVAQPVAGSVVRSPLDVAGTVGSQGPRNLAVVVSRREPDGTLVWCGNGPLTVDGDRFAGTVSFTVDADTPGVVEVMTVDPVSGTVIDRLAVPVDLQAGR
jgi:hypothetical protein